MVAIQQPQNKPCSLDSVICCPCEQRSALVAINGSLQCSSTTCPKQGQEFLIIGQPILIDFDNSVFEVDNYNKIEDGSVLNRKTSPLLKRIQRFLWGTNRIAESNAATFIDLLLKLTPNPKVLIVGGGTIGSGSDLLYSHPSLQIISFDVYRSEFTQFIADAHNIPVKTESVDGVWVQAVLEHVLEPTTVVREIHRVLKHNGIVYSETPFMQQVHEQAYDFTRFTESGHRWLFRHFGVIDSGVVNGPGTVLIWSLRYLFSALLRNKRLGALFTYPFFWLRFLDYIVSKPYASDSASGVYFLGRKSSNAITQSEIIKFYPGVTS